MFRRARRVDSHQIEVSYRVERVVPLEPGFFWEELPTGRMLMRVDEETGKKWVVLTLDTDSFVDVFKVVFDVETRSLRVAVDEDLRLMNPEQLVLDPE
ncbi:MAG: hypothetical protein R3B99_03545 [Polyangiales bacterium]